MAATHAEAAQELVTIPTRSGVTESYLLIRNPPDVIPKVVVVAFVGGNGVIGLEGKQVPVSFGAGANFLIRLRNHLVDANFAEVLVEVPSDKLHGMSDEFRLGSDHLADVRAVLADVKKRFPDAKLFLMGTSRGTISVAALAAKLDGEVQGAILSSTVTQRERDASGLSTFNFASIKVPVLLVHHRDDGCKSSPYWAVEQLAKSWLLVSVSGGDPPQSGPCEPQSPHGYWGKDVPVAKAVKAWMLGQDFPREI